MKGSQKGRHNFQSLHCTYCALRFGIAEQYLLRQGMPFHKGCYEKTRIQKEELTYESSTKTSETSSE
jgi:hypothetical protein